MTEQQQKPEIVPTITIGITNIADVVRWVAEPADIEVRQRRAELAKEAMNLALDGVDHDEFNRTVREQARRLTHGDPR